MANKIKVSISPNEKGTDRANGLIKAIAKDDRFEPPEFIETGIDVQFSYHPGWGEYGRPKVVFNEPINVFNVELKAFTGQHDDTSDLLNSILNGHLYQQTLKLREDGAPCAIVVLGDESDLDSAIMKAVYSRGKRGEAAVDLTLSYERMVFDFEANCRGQNIGFWWLKKTPYKRILSAAHKILTGGDLSRYAPKPIGNEIQSTGLSILAGNGIGKAKAESILTKFRICLEPRMIEPVYLDDCEGIGPKLAESVGMALNVPPGMISRPKERKPGRRAVAKPQKVTA